MLEMTDKLDENPRATHYSPPAIYELNRAGVGEDLRAKGFIPRTVCWRKIDGTVLAGLDGSVLDGDPDRMVCLPLNKLGTILYEHVTKQPNVKILFKHKVTAIGQDDDKAWVDVQSPDGESRMEADYIIGCDGANSQIRRSLFGDWNFPGRTWDEQIVATNVRADALLLTHPTAQLIESLARRTTTSQSSATRTLISSFIQSTGTWRHVSRRMVYGELAMANCPGCRRRSCLPANQ